MPRILNFENYSAPAKKVLEITSFAGIDLSSAPADVDKRRSPDAMNMMPDALGNPVKRPGYSFIGNFGGRINGSFSLGGKRIIHAGDSLFLDGKKIWEGMEDGISTAQIIGEKLYIFDGAEALCFDGDEVYSLCDAAYIPTVLISKNADECEKETVLKGDGMSTEFLLEHEPKEILSVGIDGVSTEFVFAEGKIVFENAPAGEAEILIRAVFENEPGGSLKEEFNLISRRWKESFLCETGTEKKFSLSKNLLSKGPVKAWVMDKDGNMAEKIEGTDFSVDRERGKIEFFEAVPKTPVSGEDNLVIEAEKFFEGYENRINRCRRSAAFDTGGTSGRIFLCGNPEEKNRDFWCAAGDPTYWPDNYYSEIAPGGAEIIGYSIIGDYLAAHISPALDGRSIVLREAKLDEDGNMSFPIIRHLQGEEAAAANSFIYMEKEPLFLTKRGVYAVTSADISGEKYTRNRSFYINKALCEEDIENAFCAKWKQFYLISAGRKLYLLDTGQRSYGKGEPLSDFQYECYLWDGFEARILWEEEGKLFFGDGEGNVFCFTEGKYSDNGRAINAYWTVPDFAGDIFWKNKTIRTVAVEAAAFPQNEIRLEMKQNGIRKLLREWKSRISFFSWSQINWKDFTWSGNSGPRTLTLRAKIKRADKIGFRIVCDKADKAFGLYGFSIEYSENGRFGK